MNVTRINFKETLPIVEKCINECDFIAFDTEFTGKVLNGNMYDTLPSYYKKCKNGLEDYLVIQLGISTFKYDSSTNNFKHSAFNFYIFPQSVHSFNRNVNFRCQSQCIQFLASTHFDFNKLFNEGISYLTHYEQENYKKQIEERRKKRSDNIGIEMDFEPMMNISESDQKTVEEIRERIEQFIENADANQELVLGKYNSYFRRVIRNNIGNLFHSKVAFEIRADDNDNNSSLQTMVAYLRGNSEQQQIKENLKRIEEDNLFEQAVGVSYVVKRISESGKLLVGFNAFLDLFYTINQFIEKLPDDYYTFKDIANFCFPKIIDVKYMQCTTPINDKISFYNLRDTIKALSASDIEFENGTKGYKISDEKAHEAGFDAYLTGVCFLALLKEKNIDYPFDQSKLESFINKLYVYKLDNVPFMNIGGIDAKPNRDHVIHLSFSSTWKTKNIDALFNKAFGKIQIVWINSTSAFVGFQNENLARKALKTLSKKNKNCKMLSFIKYEALTNAAKPLPTKESLKEKKIFPSYPEIPDLKITRMFGCTSSPDQDSDGDDVAIDMGSKAQILRVRDQQPYFNIKKICFWFLIILSIFIFLNFNMDRTKKLFNYV